MAFPMFFGDSFAHLTLVDDINQTVADGSLALFSLAIRHFRNKVEGDK